MNDHARGAPDPCIAAARAYFPRGLEQPAGSFRFSADALLLAAFAVKSLGIAASSRSILELGTGCGVVSFAFLLGLGPDARIQDAILGIEKDPELVRAANRNALRLGLQPFFQALCADVAGIREHDDVLPESRDIVIANPPYRNPGSGRLPRGERRTAALFATGAGLQAFLAAAAYALRNRGRFFGVFGTERLQEILEGLAQNRLVPKRLKPVYGAPGKDARMALVEARKNGRPGLAFESPLFLYGASSDPGLTKEALAFCPALACNAGQSASCETEGKISGEDEEDVARV